jgi:metal-responsive CopG/Arc/MetJ family transcriptional regulator|tara:strand:- start:562 stop:750 length:189 start_codon:yes stop_codon:yes gene_type:complete
MKDSRENKEIHLNLKITNRLFILIDTIRSHYLIENERLPSRSEVVRTLLEEAIQLRTDEESV